MGTDLVPIDAEVDILDSKAVQDFNEELKQSPAMWVHVLSRILSRPTPEWAVQKREGPYSGLLTYVDGAYAVATLSALSSLGISADFDIVQTDTATDAIECLGKLTFSYYCNESWHSTSRSQWGDCEIRSGMSRGSAKKGASTDALKKCLSAFGWAHDVYSTPMEHTPPPSKEDLNKQSITTLFTIGKNKGMTETEVRAWVKEQTELEPEELAVKDLAAVKRRLQRVERVPETLESEPGNGTKET